MVTAPILPVSCAEWLASTRHLTALQRGVLISLRVALMEAGGKITNDAERLARLCGSTRSAVAGAVDILCADGLLLRAGGFIQSVTVDAALDMAKERSSRASVRAAARWNGRGGECHSNATAMLQHCHSIEEPLKNNEKTPKSKNKTDKSSSTRGTRLPQEWVLTMRLGKLAMDIGLTEAETRAEAAKFRDYWVSQPGQKGTKLDWEATWRNWCRGALERRRSPRPGQAPAVAIADPQNATRQEWEKRMIVFAKMGANGGWHSSWGPRPGEAGCLVPMDLLKTLSKAA